MLRPYVTRRRAFLRLSLRHSHILKHFIRNIFSKQVVLPVRIIQDMPAWCKATGHEYLGMEEDENGEIKVYVKKTHD